MIYISLKDKELEAKPEVRKYLDKLEKIINDKLLEEKLIKMREEIELDIMIYGTSITDSDGNRIDPQSLYRDTRKKPKN